MLIARQSPPMFPYRKMSRRPFSVTLLALLVLSFSVLNIYGFFWALRQRDFLQALPLAVPVWYLALRTSFWGTVGVAIFWGLWRGQTWVWLGAQIGSAGFVLHYWLDALFLEPSPGLAWRSPFEWIATLVGLACAFYVLYSPRGRIFFSK